MFNTLHTMFETQYTEQWTALDEIAERIRALGFNAPGSYAEFVATVVDQGGTGRATRRTGARWCASWWSATRRSAGPRARCSRPATNAGDDPTVDLLTQRLQTHEKYAWMLRSLLE
jgi:starvation-inducible DNA-binding protein